MRHEVALVGKNGPGAEVEPLRTKPAVTPLADLEFLPGHDFLTRDDAANRSCGYAGRLEVGRLVVVDVADGVLPYNGNVREKPEMTGVPCSLLQGIKGRHGDVALPGESGYHGLHSRCPQCPASKS